MSSIRQWLRPKWYVVDIGSGWVGGSAYPGTMRIMSADEPDPVCTRCGVDCPDGGYALTSGYVCHECEPIVRPYVEPSAVRKLWRRVAWPIQERYERLFWWYAERFGERVVLRS